MRCKRRLEDQVSAGEEKKKTGDILTVQHRESWGPASTGGGADAKGPTTDKSSRLFPKGCNGLHRRPEPNNCQRDNKKKRVDLEHTPTVTAAAGSFTAIANIYIHTYIFEAQTRCRRIQSEWLLSLMNKQRNRTSDECRSSVLETQEVSARDEWYWTFRWPCIKFSPRKCVLSFFSFFLVQSSWILMHWS